MPFSNCVFSAKRATAIVKATTHYNDPKILAEVSRNLGEPQRAVFRYFAGIDTVREEVRADHGCRLLVVQYGRVAGEPEPLAGWTAIWSGARRGDDTERFVLYKRDP